MLKIRDYTLCACCLNCTWFKYLSQFHYVLEVKILSWRTSISKWTSSSDIKPSCKKPLTNFQHFKNICDKYTVLEKPKQMYLQITQTHGDKHVLILWCYFCLVNIKVSLFIWQISINEQENSACITLGTTRINTVKFCLYHFNYKRINAERAIMTQEFKDILFLEDNYCIVVMPVMVMDHLALHNFLWTKSFM